MNLTINFELFNLISFFLKNYIKWKKINLCQSCQDTMILQKFFLLRIIIFEKYPTPKKFEITLVNTFGLLLVGCLFLQIFNWFMFYIHNNMILMIPLILLLDSLEKMIIVLNYKTLCLSIFNIHFKVVPNTKKKNPINLFPLEGFQILFWTCNFAKVEFSSFSERLYFLITNWKAF